VEKLSNTLILICDDQESVHETIGEYLKIEEMDYVSAYDGLDALNKAKAIKPDLILLDLMMPKMFGTDVCKEIRKRSNVPIIMLTAKSYIDNRINGLSIGADDYLVKPFSPKELVMRVRTVLRRFTNTEPLSDILTFKDNSLKVDVIQYKVFRNDIEVYLTPVEYKLLLLMIANPSRVFSREELI